MRTNTGVKVIVPVLNWRPRPVTCIACCRVLKQPEAADDNDDADRVVVETLDCHRQDNGVDCGVAVIVDVCHLVAGQDRFDVPTDYSLWRRIIAALIDPTEYGEIVDETAFAPLAEIRPNAQPLDAPLDVLNHPMSLVECSQW
ncbi:uncharacterized protein ColSpa_11248 [Colletotrichum spaethianum]|uniref:Uncharacterized protein n=1 Tax=Colletotrichum spaethianum TaxID=700344 RepID=A0AA37PF46_9PEZI|nr:uncharacterized protein ColSpa_11248 [Colletotrichum spaethianum]GKT51067.1 hypothetical protein ColSpa_11248 [Colletotrichum spaethianum]